MIVIGEYRVKSVSLTQPLEDDMARVTLSADGRGDVTFDIRVDQAPLVGSYIRVGWMDA